MSHSGTMSSLPQCLGSDSLFPMADRDGRLCGGENAGIKWFLKLAQVHFEG